MWRFHFDTLRGPAAPIVTDAPSSDRRCRLLQWLKLRPPSFVFAAVESCCGWQSRVSVIWHQDNTANCTTQRYTMGVVIPVRLDHPTTQSPSKPLRFRCSAVLVWEHPDPVWRLAECSCYRLVETTTAAASTKTFSLLYSDYLKVWEVQSIFMLRKLCIFDYKVLNITIIN